MRLRCSGLEAPMVSLPSTAWQGPSAMHPAGSAGSSGLQHRPDALAGACAATACCTHREPAAAVPQAPTSAAITHGWQLGGGSLQVPVPQLAVLGPAEGVDGAGGVHAQAVPPPSRHTDHGACRVWHGNLCGDPPAQPARF